MWLLFLIHKKKLRFLKFSFSEIYGNEVGSVMVDKVKALLMKLYTFLCSVNSPNVEEPGGGERTPMVVGDASDPYVMVHSRYELFLEAEQSIGCSNEVDKYLAENCDGRRDGNFEVLGWWKDNSSRYPCCPKWLRMCWLYQFRLLHLSQHSAPEAALLIHFEVLSLLSWFKTLYVHKIGFKPRYQFLIANQGMRLRHWRRNFMI